MESKLFYKKPAAFHFGSNGWNEALPVGNGRLGAMVFGGIFEERLQLNEDSCYSGGFRDRNNPDAKAHLADIRRLLRGGDILQAEDLARYALTATPEFQRTYQRLGDLSIKFQLPANTSHFERGLDLDRGVAYVDFMAGGFSYRREVWASYPDDIITVRMTTDNPSGLNFDARLLRNRFCEASGAVNGDTIFVNGANGGADGLAFCIAATARAEGGDTTAIGEYLVFRGVKAAELYITAATSFRSNGKLEDCQSILQKAKNKSYADMYAAHVADYVAIEGRATLSLGENKKSHLPTDERLARLKQGEEDLGLLALYFRYGRYLLMSCSRRGSLPANLQGIWCDDFISPWDSKYTININTQMNYWPAEICNLSDCHEPLFTHIRRMYPNGVKTATSMYGAGGFVAHHNTDLWGDTAPQDTWLGATYWVMGAAWLCLHIWEHYEYNMDEGFLSAHFDLLEAACQFFVDFLIQNDEGYFVASPTISPENQYILPNGTHATLCEGATMDSQILHELFTAFEKAAAILKRNESLASRVADIKSKLPPTKIGKNGGIMEWLSDYDEAEPGHRHMSHLFGLFPGNQISAEHTPALADGARRTLALRLSAGGGHTGWSRAWIINFYARLGDGNAAYHHLLELLRHSTLPNLFDDHPPFQIDGNFGATAAIAHMLIHSTEDTIHLLKALPKEWHNGEVKGLCAKGGLVIDLKWRGAELEHVSLFAKFDYKGKLIHQGVEYKFDLKQGEKMEGQLNGLKSKM